MKALRGIADNRSSGSLATKLRRRRFELFRSLLESLPRPVRVLDVGGTELFWRRMEFVAESGVEVVLLNLTPPSTTASHFVGVSGDARRLQFRDDEFDVVFSNSVIEHVGTFNDQRLMANEVMRVGRRYFVQTPNRLFPIEPHFLFPYFQFLPTGVQASLLQRFDLGWCPRIQDRAEAVAFVAQIRLLSELEVRRLFPHATMYKEQFLGMTKSFIAYGGWDRSTS